MMNFLIKFAQIHESFRLAEIQALAEIEGVDLAIINYNDQVSRVFVLVFLALVPLCQVLTLL